VPEFEHHRAVRVIADPATIDSAIWGNEDALVVRFAPDEAFVLSTTKVAISDEHAIVEPEAGYLIATLGSDDVDDLVGHADWSIPEFTGTVAQGKVAGVPIKLVLSVDEPAMLLVQAAYADELRERLGW
jgi:hypothetical protein